MPLLRLIRHAASRSNDPGLHGDPDWATLSEAGHAQARAWAAGCVQPPSLLVLSPALRSVLTAAPLMARHPHVLAETWPVGEFTYLPRPQTAFTGPEQRRPWVAAYWARSLEDPRHVAGPGAESYAALFDRAWAAKARLQAWWGRASAGDELWMVSHAQFLWALTWCLDQPAAEGWPDVGEFRAATVRPDWPTLGWQDWQWPGQGSERWQQVGASVGA